MIAIIVEGKFLNAPTEKQTDQRVSVINVRRVVANGS
jgi:hypothetical protein